MDTTRDEYIRSLKDSELKLLIPERLEVALTNIRNLTDDEKQQLFNDMHEFIERNFLKNSKSKGLWERFFTKRSHYSIVPSESAPEVMANGFKIAVRSLGEEYYNDVQEKASKAYKKHISRKRTPAMWLLKFLAPVIFIKDLLMGKKKHD